MLRVIESCIQCFMKQVEGIDGVWSCKVLYIWNFINVEVIGSFYVLVIRGVDRECLCILIVGILKKVGVIDFIFQVEMV